MQRKRKLKSSSPKTSNNNNNFSKMKESRFMQPLRPSFLNTFNIPESYLQKLEMTLKGHPLKKVVLTTEDQPERRWIVEVEGGRRFKDGWKEFCAENELKVDDILVFTHETNLLFSVCVYDAITGCERDCIVPPPPPSDSENHHLQLNNGSDTGLKSGRLKLTAQSATCETQSQEVEAEVAETQKPDVESQSPSCQVTLTSNYIKKNTIYLPMKFMRSSGLLNKRCEITVVDGKGKPWKVHLSCKKNNGQGYFTQGWKEFQAANSFKPNDVISFEAIKTGKRPTLKCSRVQST